MTTIKTRLYGLNNTGQNGGTQNGLGIGKNELWSYNTVTMSVGGEGERVVEDTALDRFKLI